MTAEHRVFGGPEPEPDELSPGDRWIAHPEHVVAEWTGTDWKPWRLASRTREVPQRWVDEVVIALRAATVIGMRSCRDGDHLHYANHDRLIREAAPWTAYATVLGAPGAPEGPERSAAGVDPGAATVPGPEGPLRLTLETVLGPNAGESTCPMCGLHWLVTPRSDCFMPACGCYGHDSGPGNPNRPCEPCGLRHVTQCEKRGR